MPMTLEEAIRVDTVLKAAPILKDDPIVVTALNLSIEAMKRVQVRRNKKNWFGFDALPGETKE